ncbi:hypothetical protein QP027_11285 [Corynebacterium breve]|uniref:Uncharacterized protein n=1 Tax=Corynebacterium breve TaxID=3049799 RepID=A0ABY8VDB3_9CORY|nr:hypothetical protein [Corynebacterium breve]WIM67651.1 hypothetical protein QP027_11285 [Corynebacterium breve]
MTKPYEVDYAWLATDAPGNDGSSATVRMTVTGDSARQGVMTWFDDLPMDDLRVRGRDGWMVKEIQWNETKVIVDITSGGQHVADGIAAGTTEAFEILEPLGLDLTWEQLPRDSI